MKKELLFENASLQYGRRRSASPLGLSKNPSSAGLRLGYMPIHDVAPSAVTMAVATDAII